MDKIHTPKCQVADQAEKDINTTIEQVDVHWQKETVQIKSEILSVMEKEQIFTEVGLTLNYFANRINL